MNVLRCLRVAEVQAVFFFELDGFSEYILMKTVSCIK